MSGSKAVSYAEAHQDGPADELDLDSMLGEHGPDLTLSEAEVLSMQVFEIRQQLQRILLRLEGELTACDPNLGAALEETRALLKRVIRNYC